MFNVVGFTKGPGRFRSRGLIDLNAKPLDPKVNAMSCGLIPATVVTLSRSAFPSTFGIANIPKEPLVWVIVTLRNARLPKKSKRNGGAGVWAEAKTSATTRLRFTLAAEIVHDTALVFASMRPATPTVRSANVASADA
jgi:hypothetical protein